MPEIGTSGSMSGERKRSDGSQSEPQATAPLLDSTKAAVGQCSTARLKLPTQCRIPVAHYRSHALIARHLRGRRHLSGVAAVAVLIVARTGEDGRNCTQDWAN